MVYNLNGTTLSTGGGSGMLSTSEMPTASATATLKVLMPLDSASALSP